MSESNEKEIEVKYLSKIMHPPPKGEANTVYPGVPDGSTFNQLHFPLTALETEITPLFVSYRDGVTTTNFGTKILILSGSGAKTDSWVFVKGPLGGWIQPRNNANNGVVQKCVAAVKNGGYRFENWSQDVAQHRTTYKSKTIYENANANNYNGMITHAQWHPTIVRSTVLSQFKENPKRFMSMVRNTPGFRVQYERFFRKPWTLRGLYKENKSAFADKVVSNSKLIALVQWTAPKNTGVREWILRTVHIDELSLTDEILDAEHSDIEPLSSGDAMTPMEDSVFNQKLAQLMEAKLDHTEHPLTGESWYFDIQILQFGEVPRLTTTVETTYKTGSIVVSGTGTTGIFPETPTDLQTISPSTAVSWLSNQGIFSVQRPKDFVDQSWDIVSDLKSSQSGTPYLNGQAICYFEAVDYTTKDINTFLLYSDDDYTPGGDYLSAQDTPWNNLSWSMTLISATIESQYATLSGPPKFTIKGYTGFDLEPQTQSSLRALATKFPMSHLSILEKAHNMFAMMPDAMPASANDLGTFLGLGIQLAPKVFSVIKNLFSKKGDREAGKRAVGTAMSDIGQRLQTVTNNPGMIQANQSPINEPTTVPAPKPKKAKPKKPQQAPASKAGANMAQIMNAIKRMELIQRGATAPRPPTKKSVKSMAKKKSIRM